MKTSCIASYLLIWLLVHHKVECGTIPPACYDSDSSCHLYGDCCQRPTKRLSSLKCLRDDVGGSVHYVFDPHHISTKHSLGIWTVSDCPNTTNDSELIQQCSAPANRFYKGLKSIPGYDQDGVVYKNHYCAKCHNKEIVQLTASVLVRCLNRTLNNLMAHIGQYTALPDDCILEYIWNKDYEDKLHICYPTLLERCAWGNIQSLTNGSILITSANKTVTLKEYQSLEDSCSSQPVSYHLGTKCVLRNSHCSKCIFDFSKCEMRLLLAAHDEPDLFYSVFNLYNNSEANYQSILSMFQPLHQISFVCYYLSMFSLVCLLFVYATLKTLRNRAGVLVTAHATSLLLTQILLVLPNKSSFSETACTVYGFIMQFCLTSVFSWASVFGADLLMTLSAAVRIDQRSTNRLWPILCAGCLPPGCLTCLLMLFHFLPETGPLITVTSYCWYPFNKIGYHLGLSFVPLTVTICFNLVVASCLIFKLQRAFRSAQNLSASTHSYAKRLLYMTVKVSVLLGVIWIPMILFAVISPNYEAVAIGRLFAETMVSLHGVFLFLTFGFNSRVRRQLKTTSMTFLNRSRLGQQLKRSRSSSQESQPMRIRRN